jgi:hypothetical protein
MNLSKRQVKLKYRFQIGEEDFLEVFPGQSAGSHSLHTLNFGQLASRNIILKQF